MKINKLFHWLYCAVMFLPLFVLPIFALAVRSDNNYQPISVDVSQVEKVKYSQILDTSLTIDTLTEFTNIKWSDYQVNIDHISTSTLNEYPRVYGIGNFEIGHKYYFRAIPINTYGSIGGRFLDSDNQTQAYFTPYGNIVTANFPKFDLYANFPANSSSYHFSFYLNIFDLTYMFGSGNEPNIQDFNTLYTANYYSYGLNTYYLLNNGTITYNDTDFGSQTVYTLYKEVDIYFNYDNVFNFGTLYSWLELNFFNGSAPLGFFIFWHLLIYWLLTSLLWLLFDVLMYVPMFIHRWLDKASIS